MSVAYEIEETEVERVERWRAGVLMRAGFEGEHAFELAERHDVDLHEATSLVARGCPSELAVRILR